jgi:ribonucleoside-diphosphate reductase alpha chain
LYSLVTELIGQSGRRGALMISIDCNHPDIEKFIDIKNDLNKVTKANISIKLTDEFMKAVKENKDWTLSFTRKETNETVSRTVKARELFNRIALNNWNMAEPGALFWDRISNWNLLSEDTNFEYAGVNP